MTKKIFFGIGVALLGLVVGAAAIVSAKPSKMVVKQASGDTYSITLDQNTSLSNMTSSYQNNFETEVTTPIGTTMKLNVVNGKTSDGNLIDLAPRGMIYNFGTGSGNHEFAGLSGVTAKFTGALSIRTAVGGRYSSSAGVALGASQALTSNSKLTLTTSKYFELVAGEGGAIIESVTLEYSCDSSEYNVNNLNSEYTTVGADGYTYKLTINNGSATVASLDKPTATTANGTVTMSSATNVAIAFSLTSPMRKGTFNYTLSDGGHQLTFVSQTGKSGSAVPAPETNYDKVYKVENFESYSKTGQGYTNATTKYETSGLRAEIYADYYTGSSSGEIGGTGWPIMTSTDNTNYNSQKGHNSSKVGIFKFSTGMGMRYISMNSLYGVKQVIGKGSTLSFWARGAYTNQNFNTNHSANTPMKFYAYYDTPLTPSNQQTVRESHDFTVQAGSEWQHFEMPLTSGRIYYGFGFFAQQSSGSTQYLPIDDIEIYTASPYAEYVAPVAVTGVTLNKNATEIVRGSSETLTATVAPSDATNKDVSWSSSNTSVATVDANGLVTAVAVGNANITVTTDDGGFSATCAVTVTEPVTDYPEGTFNGTATVAGSNFTITLAIGNQSNGLVAVRLSTKDAGATGISYNTSTHQVTITTSGDYSGMTYGTITGTYDKTNDRITNISCSGSISSYVSNNGSITATRPSNLWNCDGTTSQLQSLFKRRYMSGSWQVDNSNADRITSNTTEFVSGTGAVKRRGYSGGAVALNFNSDFSPAKTVANVGFWVYNSSASDITLRMWGYKATGFGSNFETGSVTAKASGWSYVQMGFTSASVYNWQIADFNNTGVYLTFDDIILF